MLNVIVFPTFLPVIPRSCLSAYRTSVPTGKARPDLLPLDASCWASCRQTDCKLSNHQREIKPMNKPCLPSLFVSISCGGTLPRGLAPYSVCLMAVTELFLDRRGWQEKADDRARRCNSPSHNRLIRELAELHGLQSLAPSPVWIWALWLSQGKMRPCLCP